MMYIFQYIEIQEIRIDLVEDEIDSKEKQEADHGVAEDLFGLLLVAPHVSASHIHIACIGDTEHSEDRTYTQHYGEHIVEIFRQGMIAESFGETG